MINFFSFVYTFGFKSLTTSKGMPPARDECMSSSGISICRYVNDCWKENIV